MKRLGIHSFVWTDGTTQEGLEMALEKSAEHGYRCIEFAYLRPELFDLDRLARKSQELDVQIGVTMGLPRDEDAFGRGLRFVSVQEEERAKRRKAERRRRRNQSK